MHYLFLASTSILLLLTILPLIPSSHWFFRTWEFPRVQIAALLLLNFIACMVFFDSYELAIITAIATIYQCAWIFPYTVLMPKQVTAEPKHNKSIKIMTCNVLMTNKSANKLIAQIQHYQPDIVVTLETNQWWQDALAVINSDYPHRVNQPLENLYGMHVFSKFPFEELEVKNLIQKDIPSVHTYIKLSDTFKVKCHFLHPAPPSPTENTYSKNRDLELLLIADIVDSNEPTIVTGDLNDVAWSATTRKFRQKSHLLDPRIGRGFFNTFHAQYALLRWPLDHIFHSPDFGLKTIERVPSIDSDHFPLFSHLSYYDNDG